jgi:hypothetical protein
MAIFWKATILLLPPYPQKIWMLSLVSFSKFIMLLLFQNSKYIFVYIWLQRLFPINTKKTSGFAIAKNHLQWKTCLRLCKTKLIIIDRRIATCSNNPTRFIAWKIQGNIFLFFVVSVFLLFIYQFLCFWLLPTIVVFTFNRCW